MGRTDLPVVKFRISKNKGKTMDSCIYYIVRKRPPSLYISCKALQLDGTIEFIDIESLRREILEAF